MVVSCYMCVLWVIWSYMGYMQEVWEFNYIQLLQIGFLFNISNATMKQVVKCHVFHEFIFELVILFGFAFQLLSLIPNLMT